MKRTEFNTISGPLADRYSKKNKLDVFLHPESFRRPDWLLTSTPFQTSMFAKAFRIPQSRCLELGYPRNRILTVTEQERISFIKKYEPRQTWDMVQRCKGYDKVFVYMPTWRDSQRTVFTQSMDLERLNGILAAKNQLLILKPHANVIVDGIKEMSNIILASPRMDIYPVLPYAHVLITDYSSILYDWLLME
ncbi:MAG: CDP-glycerol glycerophosphotransferase family protein, partial [Bacteroidaceae bacterium]|nr:CDP-glycerol glycerophosphotransferase family protein [Bacteroidaceae bacterium]